MMPLIWAGSAAAWVLAFYVIQGLDSAVGISAFDRCAQLQRPQSNLPDRFHYWEFWGNASKVAAEKSDEQLNFLLRQHRRLQITFISVLTLIPLSAVFLSQFIS